MFCSRDFFDHKMMVGQSKATKTLQQAYRSDGFILCEPGWPWLLKALKSQRLEAFPSQSRSQQHLVAPGDVAHLLSLRW